MTCENRTEQNGQRVLKLYRNEPLLKFFCWCGFTPLTLGIRFLCYISLTLCAGAALSELNIEKTGDYLSYFSNISWSVSLVYLFPFIVALTLKYYQEIPKLFDYLIKKTGRSENDAEIIAFRAWLDKKFNDLVSPIVFFLITLLLNSIYFFQVLANEKDNWMVGGMVLKDIFRLEQGLSYMGLYAAIVQIILIYWVFNLVWKTAVFAWGLHEFFKKRGFRIDIDPVHPDGCCGLKRISSVCLILNLILFMLGIYVSLKVVDKMHIQQSSLFDDIGNPLMLGTYAVLAPLLFFSPLAACHEAMQSAKLKFIGDISEKIQKLQKQLKDINPDGKGLAAVQTFSEMEKIRNELIRTIPVWPFNFKSLEAFFGTVVIPLAPMLLPIIFQLFGGMEKPGP